MRLVPKNCSILAHLLTILERFLLIGVKGSSGLMADMVASKSSMLRTGQGGCIVFLGKTLDIITSHQILKFSGFYSTIKFQLTCEEHYFPGQIFFNPQFK